MKLKWSAAVAVYIEQVFVAADAGVALPYTSINDRDIEVPVDPVTI